MKQFIQILLIVWFIVLNLFILIPSYHLLNYEQENESKTLNPPNPPPPLLIKDIKVSDPDATQKNQVSIATQQAQTYAQQVSAYTQQVNAFTQQVNLEKLKLENSKKGSEITRYNTVIKDSLIKLLADFLAALITFAFVNAGTGLVDNYIRARHNLEVKPIKFF
jgi:flagellar basal body-associated protein FliL